MAKSAGSRNWLSERLYTFSELARLPNLPIAKSHWVFRQWARRGMVLQNGSRRRVKLPSVRVGNLRYTSIEALREFVAKFLVTEDGD